MSTLKYEANQDLPLAIEKTVLQHVDLIKGDMQSYKDAHSQIGELGSTIANLQTQLGELRADIVNLQSNDGSVRASSSQDETPCNTEASACADSSSPPSRCVSSDEEDDSETQFEPWSPTLRPKPMHELFGPAIAARGRRSSSPADSPFGRRSQNPAVEESSSTDEGNEHPRSGPPSPSRGPKDVATNRSDPDAAKEHVVSSIYLLLYLRPLTY